MIIIENNGDTSNLSKNDNSKLNKNKDIYKALFKKAVGYITNESTEEYTVSDDELKLCKKKVTKKHIPPDISALKLLIDLNDVKEITDMTDTELEEEKKRLLTVLKEYENGNIIQTPQKIKEDINED